MMDGGTQPAISPFPSGWGKDVAPLEGISGNDLEIDPSNVDPQSDFA